MLKILSVNLNQTSSNSPNDRGESYCQLRVRVSEEHDTGLQYIDGRPSIGGKGWGWISVLHIIDRPAIHQPQQGVGIFLCL